MGTTKKILPFPSRLPHRSRPLEPAIKGAKVVPPPKRTLREVIRKVGVAFEVWHL
jgi:hypothetical protein